MICRFLKCQRFKITGKKLYNFKRLQTHGTYVIDDAKEKAEWETET